MRRLAALAVLVASAAPLSAQDKTVTIPLNGHNFTLPAGFTIELAAGQPLIERPVTIAFDEVGHLYVADSSGSNEKLTIQLEKKPHRIVRLDPAKDGVFAKGHVYADKIMFPEGTMWHKGSLYVSGPPSIWKLTDTKGTGVSDTRVEWYQGKTLGGCGNDLHGPWLGPDGWFYWTKGGFQPQKHTFAGKEIETRASTLFRAKPDGSQREPIFAGGMDNPVGLAFTPGGEPIVTNTFLVYPSNGQRDGLIHAVWGGVYGKDFADVLAPHIRTSTKLMPVMEHLGPAAPTGIVRYDSDVFGPEYQDNMFVGQFNLRKVSRHILTPKGATFESKTSDFVVSDNHDFHPTDVVMDADGSLLIVDTGGWYKLCCPTSQLVKPDVMGAIYRVRKVGATGPDDPRGLKIDWRGVQDNGLVRYLSDPRPAVRARARDALADRGDVPALDFDRIEQSALAQREAVWTLARIGSAFAESRLALAVASKDETVRHAALASLRHSRFGVPSALNLIATTKATAQDLRIGAEVIELGWREVWRDAQPVFDHLLLPRLEQLAKELETTNDPVVAHSINHLLLDLGSLRSDGKFLDVLQFPVRFRSMSEAEGSLRHAPKRLQAAWLLDKSLREIPLSGKTLLSLLADSDAEVREAAWIAASRQRTGSSIVADFLRKNRDVAAESRTDLLRHLAKMSAAGEIQKLLAELASDNDSVAKLALAAMAQANPKNVPPVWEAAITTALERPHLEVEAVAAARRLRMSESTRLIHHLDKIANDESRPVSLRLYALAAMPQQTRSLSSASFGLVRKHLDAEQPTELRGLAVDVLGRSKLTASQFTAIADVIPTVSPLEIDRVLELFAGQKDDAVGARLMDALEQPKLAASLRVDSLERRLKNFGPAVQQRATKLYARLNAELVGQRAHLEDLLAKLPTGDVRRGQLVFNREKSACVACHTIGYVGGMTGPDLTRIGSIRTRRDLLEAIVFPSASFVRGYEPFLIATTDGKTHNGLIRTENADEVTLTTGVNQEVRIARKDIESIQPGRVSVMPAGLEQQLSASDLADLVAFLGACR